MSTGLEDQLRAANARVEKARQRLGAVTALYEKEVVAATDEQSTDLRSAVDEAQRALAVELDRVRLIEADIKKRDEALREAAENARWATAFRTLDEAKRLAALVDSHVAAAGDAFRQIVPLVERVPVAAEYGAHHHAASVQSGLDVALAKAGLAASIPNSGDVRPTDLRVEDAVKRIAAAVLQLTKVAA